MSNKYRGEVEFTDSSGKSYVLRLGTNQYISIQSVLEKLDGIAWQRAIFHTALVNGAASQQAMTVEEAGDLIDDVGVSRTDDLIQQTRWGVMSAEALAKKRAAIEQAHKTAEGTANPQPPTIQ